MTRFVLFKHREIEKNDDAIAEYEDHPVLSGPESERRSR
jgi:hypothetical protein